MCVCKCMRVCVRACVCACVTKETEGDSLGPLRSTTGFPLSKRSQYGLKRYANRLKRYANGASTASIYIQQAESVLCLCVRAISLQGIYDFGKISLPPSNAGHSIASALDDGELKLRGSATVTCTPRGKSIECVAYLVQGR